MDQATSSLASITEKAIERTIRGFSKNITTIIAHRLSTIMRQSILISHNWIDKYIL
jgi:ATP-binding cassette subfamily B protein